MSFFQRIKRLLSIKSINVLKKMEDSIEVYEYELKKSKESIDNLQKTLSKIHADKRSADDKVEKSRIRIEKLQMALDQAIESNEDEIGEEAYHHLNAEKQKIEMHRAAVDKYQEALDQLQKQYESLKAKYEDKHAKLTLLRSKNDYAKSMQAINKEISTHYSSDEFSISSFEGLEDEINNKIYYEEDRNKRLGEETSAEEKLEKRLVNSSYKMYKEKKLAEAEETASSDS